MNECVFCQIVAQKKKADIVYENKNVLVMLDEDWAVKGHTLVIWKHHALNSTDLNEKDFLLFSDLQYKVEKALLKHTTMKRSIILKSGLLVSHLHYHIYPVPLDISFKQMISIFAKKVKYIPTNAEKQTFIQTLKDELT